MTIMDMFNEQLKNLSAEGKRLKKDLKQIAFHDENWTEIKAEHAFRIVDAERFEVESEHCFNGTHYSFITIKSIDVFFSFEECSIEDMDTASLEKYVQALLDDLNKLSKIIQFSISETCKSYGREYGRIFEIGCTF